MELRNNTMPTRPTSIHAIIGKPNVLGFIHWPSMALTTAESPIGGSAKYPSIYNQIMALTNSKQIRPVNIFALTFLWSLLVFVRPIL